ncbi:hypothetical protein VNO77_20441 [Canavalia gladiata]|uniref:Plus3 domain-containing protein n=1 Tax=Canavalia gladiata TaxID=3824 RepID=A0AAN9LSS7_CANGL
MVHVRSRWGAFPPGWFLSGLDTPQWTPCLSNSDSVGILDLAHAELYKIGTRTTDVMLEILHLNWKEVISIDGSSNQEFSEDECKRLRQRATTIGGKLTRLHSGPIRTIVMPLLFVCSSCDQQICLKGTPKTTITLSMSRMRMEAEKSINETCASPFAFYWVGTTYATHFLTKDRPKPISNSSEQEQRMGMLTLTRFCGRFFLDRNLRIEIQMVDLEAWTLEPME